MPGGCHLPGACRFAANRLRHSRSRPVNLNMKHLWPATLVTALTACLFGTGPHVPSAYQGTTPITIVNAWDHEMCAFSVFQADPGADNWLGSGGKLQNLAP